MILFVLIDVYFFSSILFYFFWFLGLKLLGMYQLQLQKNNEWLTFSILVYFNISKYNEIICLDEMHAVNAFSVLSDDKAMLPIYPQTHTSKVKYVSPSKWER